MLPASWKKRALKLCRFSQKFGKYLTKHAFHCKCVLILYLHLFCNNCRKGMSASWSLGGWALLPLLCFVEIQWLHVHRIGVRGYGYIHGYPRKNLWIWIWIWMGNFISTASLRKSTILPTPLLFRLKFEGVPFGVDPSCWGLHFAESEMVRLVSGEIIFAEFERMWSRYLNVTDRRTDGQTDGQTIPRYA